MANPNSTGAPASKQAAQAGANTTNDSTEGATGGRKRRAPLGPKVSKLIVLYEAEGPVTFHGIYRGSSTEIFDAMSKFNDAGTRVKSKTFEITSKPAKTSGNEEDSV